MGGIIGAGGEISWPKPTRPGDILQVVSEVEEVVPSRSRPDRGMARVRSETRNQRDEIVQVLLAKLIVPRRAATSPQPQGELAGQPNSQRSDSEFASARATHDANFGIGHSSSALEPEVRDRTCRAMCANFGFGH